MRELTWVEVWRDFLCPQLNDAGLRELREALARDAATLITGASLYPPDIQGCRDWPVESACPLGYALWHGSDDPPIVGVLCRRFTEAVIRCDEMAGQAVAFIFLRWVDNTPRDLMRAQLIEEVDRELLRREDAEADLAPVAVVRIAE